MKKELEKKDKEILSYKESNEQTRREFEQVEKSYEQDMNQIQKIMMGRHSQIKRKVENIGNHEKRECVICSEEFKSNEVRATLSCNHDLFHKHCIKNWLKNSEKKTCPLCISEGVKIQS